MAGERIEPRGAVASGSHRRTRRPRSWRRPLGLRPSTERYEAPAGELYESCGIPQLLTAPVWVEGDLRRGYRRAVDVALSLNSVTGY